MILDSLKELEKQQRLNQSIILWGIGNQTKDVITWLKQNGYGDRLLFIVDNFKRTFCREYEGIRVKPPAALTQLEKDSFAVILSVNYAKDVWKQLSVCGVTQIYNLRNLQEWIVSYRYDIPYHFMDRRRGKKYLCYVLAGYEPELWKDTIGRLEIFQDQDVDYCLVLSGRQDAVLEKTAEWNGWSYLYTDINQVCYIQNLVQHCVINGEFCTCYFCQHCVVVNQRCHRIASFLRLVLTKISGTLFTIIYAVLY